MEVSKITATEPKKTKPSVALATAGGAGIGALSRYVIPRKGELNNLFNKASVDQFVSSTAKRGADRSILKFGAIGALIAGGLSLVSKALKYDSKENTTSFEYNKLGAIIDAPAYACEIVWHQD